jgi:threonine dehydrogenase-like Zn-dependent dehydrogenase
MKALFYIGTEASEVRDADAPVAGEGETLVDLVFCGICGSDMHAWHGKDARRVPPLILGHEAVGTARNGPFTGKPVAINPLISCASCHYCNTGAPQLCTMRELIGLIAICR